MTGDRGSGWLDRAAVRAPGVSAARRGEAARRAAVGALERGLPEEAERVVDQALARIDDVGVRAELLGAVTRWSLERGERPSRIREAYAAELDVADELFSRGELREAAQAFVSALRLESHRVLHFDSLSSPLAEDPDGFTAPLRTSTVAQAVRAPRGRTGPRSEADADSRRVRLLVATRINADFLAEILERYADHDGFELRFIDFGDVHELDRFAKSPEKLAFQTLAGKPALRRTTEEAFRRHLEWADVVLVEWCTALAALLTQVDPRDTRIVVRMHSYEAFTLWPHLIDFSRVDDMVFVSEHLRDLAVSAVPGLQSPHQPRLHVIPNAMDLRRFARPKGNNARFTLGVVGASKMVKDPRWAIEVLRHLREHDERYRLLLIRGKLQDPSPAAVSYAEALREDLRQLEPSGAVRVLGHTDDVPSALQEIGIVVSSSVRESFHNGLVEGAASGAVPVVRDWPFFPGAARELFPDEWVADTPEAAARRILEVTASDEVWRNAGERAARLVLERWDWTVVGREFDELLRPLDR